MAFVDERRYVTAMLGLRALSEGHVREFLQAINSMGARPGDGLWRVIPGLGQAALLVLFQLNPNTPPSLQVPQAFNVLIMSLNMLLLYQIYRRFFPVSFALLGVALYSSLVNTNLYLRHILPYDHSLFFFLLALWLLLSPAEKKPISRYWWVGLISGISYAVYPGYFMGPAVLLALTAWMAMAPRVKIGHANKPVSFGPLGAQLAGLVAVLVLFEALAQLSDTSYLASSRYIATTVTQGSFEEGFSFIGHYFWEVEGLLGVGLLVLFGAGLLLSIRHLHAAHAHQFLSKDSLLLICALMTISFVAWFGYAAAVQFAHKLVFYGRILHFFVPIILLGALVALHSAACHWQQSKTTLVMSGWALALWHFGAFERAYRTVTYPCDVAYDCGIQDARQIASIDITGCDKGVVYYRLFGPRIRDQRTSSSPKYQFVNFAYLYPISCYQAPPATLGKVAASVPYFMKYTPYQFEGHNPKQRALLQKHDYDFRILSVE
ncbi:glycosyltransferase family 39 protein [Hymenobacter sp. BT770]|uniref:glycosyltransferase family 39 protein n=1 Tax=Hymenobacter sp. BT770 TaxID=2886942 RepID=UPI001D12F248|nr:glycosyltransferase family 39 protein [Hymenobacter sp. BT770]MDO3415964.1 glycosyltransferase family 39 protein [Hymenobacter sp. BT770]